MKQKKLFSYYGILPDESIMNPKTCVRDLDRVGDLMFWFNKRWHFPQSKGALTVQMKSRDNRKSAHKLIS